MPELQDPVIVAEGAEYALLSSGDESAYILRCKEDDASVFLKGDDLDTFLRDYESVRSQYPGYATDQILAQLWDQGGYSWMAGADGD